MDTNFGDEYKPKTTVEPFNLSIIGFNISSFVLIFARLSVPNSGNFECSSYLTLAYFLQTRHNFSPQWTQYGLVSAIPQFVLMVLFDRICKLILFPINHQNFLPHHLHHWPFSFASSRLLLLNQSTVSISAPAGSDHVYSPAFISGLIQSFGREEQWLS